ncbi:Yt521-b-like splicing protein [Mycena sanguinolenta]|uniref:Yt521-b-like splicing protein n=1 Tax=Mycena sanguinolenta TaxID=230812 RepID=A0A8H6XWQ7_9AGAR|nr:Yt521-b-like splicing protein [Mycena sanguinolenta]
MAHPQPNVFQYPPSFHVQEQPQSMLAGYPTLASYSQYQSDASQYNPPQSQGSPSLQQPSPVFPGSFQPYSSPMSPISPAYPNYPQPPTSFSPPPALYQHQHQQHVYPGAPGTYPQYASPASGQDGDAGGTWWYVPSHARHTPHYEGAPQPTTYSYYPQPPPPQPDGGEYPGSPTSPTYAPPSTPSSSSSAPSPVHTGRDRPIVRRAYHPNPPAHRSDWVMWAGNVPSDAVHDELWRFFTQPLDGESATASSSNTVDDGGSERGRNGVGSIFLISRSSCAFVNYETEADLHAAIARFNGVPLRADPRCPRLVCRVRRKDDDLRAGVGGQRGSGMHTRWVKAKQKAQDDSGSSMTSSASEPGTPSSGSHSLEPGFSALSIGSSDDEGAPSRPPPRPHAGGSSSSGSHASTNSSLLRQYFPQRYFILKSLTQDDLDKSVHTGVWATQKHNEGVLDRAFRTSKDVFLIFSVNKSGEFYGYARMAGSIGQVDGGRVTWARRDSTASNTSGRGAPMASKSVPLFGAAGTAGDLPSPQPEQPLLSSNRLVGESPQPFEPSGTPLQPSTQGAHTAPAVLGRPHRNISVSSGYKGPSASLDQGVGISQRRDIELDENAPFRAMRSSPAAGETSAAAEGHSQQKRRESIGSAAGAHVSGLGSVEEEPGTSVEGAVTDRVGNVEQPRDESWGENFKLQWLCTERLPFQRTRQLRNPWNHDREIKVSRDGTELEPSVGQALLEEWQSYLSSGGWGRWGGSGASDAAGRDSVRSGGAFLARGRGCIKFTIMINEERNIGPQKTFQKRPDIRSAGSETLIHTPAS